MKKSALYFILFSWFFLAVGQTVMAAPATAMMDEVYTQLKKAIGDTERTWPTLEIRPGASSVLAYNKRKNIIFVDEKALAICESFGTQEKDAFAFLLAHEMTHFYQEHHWQEAGFATSFLTNKHSFEAHVVDEKEADLFGAFVTYLAGYQAIKIVPNVFDKVYTVYGLTEQLQDYPSLHQRKATALEICNKVKELIQVFETANYLTAMGEYITAAAAYEYVLQFVKYKELYNNIGASLVAAAALQPEYGQLPYHYPIELDLTIPLREGAAAEKSDLLKKAIDYLTIASNMDTQHYSTFINLACAYTLNKEYEKTGALINQLYLIVKKKKQVAELSILQGIIHARLNNKEEAIRLFAEAVALNDAASINQLASYNRYLVKHNEPKQSILSAPILVNSTVQKIDDIDLTYQNDFPFKEIIAQDNLSDEELILNFHTTKNAALVHIATSDKTIAILNTTNQQTTQGIGKGATYEQIKKTYPSPKTSVINHSKGYYLVLPLHKLLFNMNAQNQVMAWGIYEIY